MFELSVQRVFSAAHAIVAAGRREAVHGHDWRVTAVVAGDALDSDGLLCDFHELEGQIDRILAPFLNANLNETAPFDRVNPTAERMAQHIGESLAIALPKGVRLKSLSVTEAPGCEATYRPD